MVLDYRTMKYSVKQVSKLSGVSIRTLHHYDRIGLLKPELRTEANYRLYGNDELLRLQQILFYKALDFPLKEIKEILDNPEFEVIQALSEHKTALSNKQKQIDTLIETIDKTINQLKGQKMLKPEQLYEGLSPETAKEYREKAIEKYGEENVQTSENYLLSLSRMEFDELKKEQTEVTERLASLINEKTDNTKVQNEVAKHYAITRQFWGTANNKNQQADQYVGLGELFVSDERFTQKNGQPRPEFAQFLCNAMKYFAKTSLK